MPLAESRQTHHRSAAVARAEAELPPQTWVEIDLDALVRNFRRVGAGLPAEMPIIFSVKKDAYGHGLTETVRALEGEPQYYAAGVATVDEALALRAAGIESRILCFSVVRGAALRAALVRGVVVTVTNLEESAEADQVAGELGLSAVLHFKLDTGMGRVGRMADEVRTHLPEILRLPHVRVAGLYTHLPDGWRQPAEARRQMDDLARFAREAGLEGRLLHLGGSDALSVRDHTELGAVRAGISVYGYHEGVRGLEPAMHFKTRVIYRRRATTGTRISYNGLHTLARDSELAIVGAGYGNGYPVSMSNRASVLIRGQRCPVLGRVCMDQTVVDVTDAPEVRCGDEVVLFGVQAGQRLGADELAALGSTIPYELICAAGQINPRFYQPANALPENSESKPSRNDG